MMMESCAFNRHFFLLYYILPILFSPSLAALSHTLNNYSLYVTDIPCFYLFTPLSGPIDK